MKYTAIQCDLCGNQIKPYNPRGQGMILGGRQNQVWPIEGEDLDICPDCCEILGRAAVKGLLTLHLDEVYKRAGFTKKDGLWVNER